MDKALNRTLLGGMSPEVFMRRHWQKRPLLIRGAGLGLPAVLDRTQLVALAGRDDVESRLVVHGDRGWKLRRGPFGPRALPARSRPRWTLLVQGVDQQLDAARDLLDQFRFVPDARLDDLMVSYATDGGGVGPHFDSYDVFLLQLHGRRTWRIGRLRDPQLVPDVPLKILDNFRAEQSWTLDPGDMLYLPPRWAHDGVAEGECMTASIGFRAEGRHALGHAVLQRMLDEALAPEDDPLYRDPSQGATEQPAQLPAALLEFARDAVMRQTADERQLACALGETLSELKINVSFDADIDARAPSAAGSAELRLDRRSRMLYDRWHVFINGESFVAGGRDAKLMRQLADRRCLTAAAWRSASAEARALLEEWTHHGWVHWV
jgi:50S ribosomal protein L16 3-hydroxylase